MNDSPSIEEVGNFVDALATLAAELAVDTHNMDMNAAFVKSGVLSELASHFYKYAYVVAVNDIKLGAFGDMAIPPSLDTDTEAPGTYL